jgi:hypothetical protein
MSIKENSLYVLMGILGIGSLLLVILMATIAPLQNTVKPSPTSFISILLMVVLIPAGIFLVYFVDTLISGPTAIVSKQVIHTNLQSKAKEASGPFQLIIGILFFIVVAVVFFCLTVHPVERFVSASIASRLDALEARTCAIIKRADQFVESKIRSSIKDGPKDSDNNDIYTEELQAQVKAALTAAHGSNFVNCNPGAPTSESRIDKIETMLLRCKSTPGQPLNCMPPKSPEDIIKDRISALEATLRAFTGPTIVSAFNEFVNSSMYVDASKGCPATPIPCYDFASITDEQKAAILNGQNILDLDTVMWVGKEDVSTQEKKLNYLEFVIECQEQKLLQRIDQNVDDMKKGKITDCQRKIMKPPTP